MGTDAIDVGQDHRWRIGIRRDGDDQGLFDSPVGYVHATYSRYVPSGDQVTRQGYSDRLDPSAIVRSIGITTSLASPV